MVGDWLVTEKLKQSIESGEIKLGSDEYNKLLNTAQVDVNDLGELKITGDLWKTLPDGRQTIIVRPTTYNVWAVTGSLTLVRRTDGTYGVFNDTYDFEMHNSGILAIPRNIETVVGSPRCAATSGCTGY